ncbi:hypothetical protein E4T49_04733 [Aureobasidium sp. EXF-10728]|nr:hypothetical protein E4T49_04733 [Aureobasidium sp. EXF-10728]
MADQGDQPPMIGSTEQAPEKESTKHSTPGIVVTPAEGSTQNEPFKSSDDLLQASHDTKDDGALPKVRSETKANVVLESEEEPLVSPEEDDFEISTETLQRPVSPINDDEYEGSVTSSRFSGSDSDEETRGRPRTSSRDRDMSPSITFATRVADQAEIDATTAERRRSQEGLAKGARRQATKSRSPLAIKSITRDGDRIVVTSPTHGTITITDPKVIEELDKSMEDGQFTLFPVKRALALSQDTQDVLEQAFQKKEILRLAEARKNGPKHTPPPVPERPGSPQFGLSSAEAEAQVEENNPASQQRSFEGLRAPAETGILRHRRSVSAEAAKQALQESRYELIQSDLQKLGVNKYHDVGRWDSDALWEFIRNQDNKMLSIEAALHNNNLKVDTDGMITLQQERQFAKTEIERIRSEFDRKTIANEQRCAELEAELTNAELVIEEMHASQTLDRTREAILTSPDKLSSEALEALDKVEKQAQNLTTTRETLSQEMTELRSGLDIVQELRDENEHLTSEEQELCNELSKLQKQKIFFEKQADESELKLQEQKQAIDKLNKAYTILDKENTQLKARVQNLQDAKDQTEVENAELKDQLEDCQNAHAKLAEEKLVATQPSTTQSAEQSSESRVDSTQASPKTLRDSNSSLSGKVSALEKLLSQSRDDTARYRELYTSANTQRVWSFAHYATVKEPWPVATREIIAQLIVTTVNDNRKPIEEPTQPADTAIHGRPVRDLQFELIGLVEELPLPGLLTSDQVVSWLAGQMGIRSIFEEICSLGLYLDNDIEQEILRTLIEHGLCYGNYDVFATFVFADKPISRQEFVTRLTEIIEVMDKLDGKLIKTETDLELARDRVTELEESISSGSANSGSTEEETCGVLAHRHLEARIKDLEKQKQELAAAFNQKFAVNESSSDSDGGVDLSVAPHDYWQELLRLREENDQYSKAQSSDSSTCPFCPMMRKKITELNEKLRDTKRQAREDRDNAAASIPTPSAAATAQPPPYCDDCGYYLRELSDVRRQSKAFEDKYRISKNQIRVCNYEIDSANDKLQKAQDELASAQKQIEELKSEQNLSSPSSTSTAPTSTGDTPAKPSEKDDLIRKLHEELEDLKTRHARCPQSLKDRIEANAAIKIAAPPADQEKQMWESSIDDDSNARKLAGEKAQLEKQIEELQNNLNMFEAAAKVWAEEAAPKLAELKASEGPASTSSQSQAAEDTSALKSDVARHGVALVATIESYERRLAEIPNLRSQVSVLLEENQNLIDQRDYYSGRKKPECCSATKLELQKEIDAHAVTKQSLENAYDAAAVAKQAEDEDSCKDIKKKLEKTEQELLQTKRSHQLKLKESDDRYTRLLLTRSPKPTTAGDVDPCKEVREELQNAKNDYESLETMYYTNQKKVAELESKLKEAEEDFKAVSAENEKTKKELRQVRLSYNTGEAPGNPNPEDPCKDIREELEKTKKELKQVRLSINTGEATGNSTENPNSEDPCKDIREELERTKARLTELQRLLDEEKAKKQPYGSIKDYGDLVRQIQELEAQIVKTRDAHAAQAKIEKLVQQVRNGAVQIAELQFEISKLEATSKAYILAGDRHGPPENDHECKDTIMELIGAQTQLKGLIDSYKLDAPAKKSEPAKKEEPKSFIKDLFSVFKKFTLQPDPTAPSVVNSPTKATHGEPEPEPESTNDPCSLYKKQLKDVKKQVDAFEMLTLFKEKFLREQEVVERKDNEIMQLKEKLEVILNDAPISLRKRLTEALDANRRQANIIGCNEIVAAQHHKEITALRKKLEILIQPDQPMKDLMQKNAELEKTLDKVQGKFFKANLESGKKLNFLGRQLSELYTERDNWRNNKTPLTKGLWKPTDPAKNSKVEAPATESTKGAEVKTSESASKTTKPGSETEHEPGWDLRGTPENPWPKITYDCWPEPSVRQQKTFDKMYDANEKLYNNPVYVAKVRGTHHPSPKITGLWTEVQYTRWRLPQPKKLRLHQRVAKKFNECTESEWFLPAIWAILLIMEHLGYNHYTVPTLDFIFGRERGPHDYTLRWMSLFIIFYGLYSWWLWHLFRSLWGKTNNGDDNEEFKLPEDPCKDVKKELADTKAELEKSKESSDKSDSKKDDSNKDDSKKDDSNKSNEDPCKDVRNELANATARLNDAQAQLNGDKCVIDWRNDKRSLLQWRQVENTRFWEVAGIPGPRPADAITYEEFRRNGGLYPGAGMGSVGAPASSIGSGSAPPPHESAGRIYDPMAPTLYTPGGPLDWFGPADHGLRGRESKPAGVAPNDATSDYSSPFDFTPFFVPAEASIGGLGAGLSDIGAKADDIVRKMGLGVGGAPAAAPQEPLPFRPANDDFLRRHFAGQVCCEIDYKEKLSKKLLKADANARETARKCSHHPLGRRVANHIGSPYARSDRPAAGPSSNHVTGPYAPDQAALATAWHKFYEQHPELRRFLAGRDPWDRTPATPGSVDLRINRYAIARAYEIPCPSRGEFTAWRAAQAMLPPTEQDFAEIDNQHRFSQIPAALRTAGDAAVSGTAAHGLPGTTASRPFSQIPEHLRNFQVGAARIPDLNVFGVDPDPCKDVKDKLAEAEKMIAVLRGKETYEQFHAEAILFGPTREQLTRIEEELEREKSDHKDAKEKLAKADPKTIKTNEQQQAAAKAQQAKFDAATKEADKKISAIESQADQYKRQAEDLRKALDLERSKRLDAPVVEEKIVVRPANEISWLRFWIFLAISTYLSLKIFWYTTLSSMPMYQDSALSVTEILWYDTVESTRGHHSLIIVLGFFTFVGLLLWLATLASADRSVNPYPDFDDDGSNDGDSKGDDGDSKGDDDEKGGDSDSKKGSPSDKKDSTAKKVLSFISKSLPSSPLSSSPLSSGPKRATQSAPTSPKSPRGFQTTRQQTWKHSYISSVSTEPTVGTAAENKPGDDSPRCKELERKIKELEQKLLVAGREAQAAKDKVLQAQQAELSKRQPFGHSVISSVNTAPQAAKEAVKAVENKVESAVNGSSSLWDKISSLVPQSFTTAVASAVTQTTDASTEDKDLKSELDSVKKELEDAKKEIAASKKEPAAKNEPAEKSEDPCKDVKEELERVKQQLKQAKDEITWLRKQKEKENKKKDDPDAGDDDKGDDADDDDGPPPGSLELKFILARDLVKIREQQLEKAEEDLKVCHEANKALRNRFYDQRDGWDAEKKKVAELQKAKGSTQNIGTQTNLPDSQASSGDIDHSECQKRIRDLIATRDKLRDERADADTKCRDAESQARELRDKLAKQGDGSNQEYVDSLNKKISGLESGLQRCAKENEHYKRVYNSGADHSECLKGGKREILEKRIADYEKDGDERVAELEKRIKNMWNQMRGLKDDAEKRRDLAEHHKLAAQQLRLDLGDEKMTSRRRTTDWKAALEREREVRKELEVVQKQLSDCEDARRQSGDHDEEEMKVRKELKEVKDQLETVKRQLFECEEASKRFNRTLDQQEIVDRAVQEAEDAKSTLAHWLDQIELNKTAVLEDQSSDPEIAKLQRYNFERNTMIEQLKKQKEQVEEELKWYKEKLRTIEEAEDHEECKEMENYYKEKAETKQRELDAAADENREMYLLYMKEQTIAHHAQKDKEAAEKDAREAEEEKEKLAKQLEERNAVLPPKTTNEDSASPADKQEVVPRALRDARRATRLAEAEARTLKSARDRLARENALLSKRLERNLDTLDHSVNPKIRATIPPTPISTDFLNKHKKPRPGDIITNFSTLDDPFGDDGLPTGGIPSSLPKFNPNRLLDILGEPSSFATPRRHPIPTPIPPYPAFEPLTPEGRRRSADRMITDPEREKLLAEERAYRAAVRAVEHEFAEYRNDGFAILYTLHRPKINIPVRDVLGRLDSVVEEEGEAENPEKQENSENEKEGDEEEEDGSSDGSMDDEEFNRKYNMTPTPLPRNRRTQKGVYHSP